VVGGHILNRVKTVKRLLNLIKGQSYELQVASLSYDIGILHKKKNSGCSQTFIFENENILLDIYNWLIFDKILILTQLKFIRYEWMLNEGTKKQCF